MAETAAEPMRPTLDELKRSYERLRQRSGFGISHCDVCGSSVKNQAEARAKHMREHMLADIRLKAAGEANYG